MKIEPATIEGITKIRDYNAIYTNETPIIHVGGVPLLMHEIALAGLLAQLNMVFIGRSGPGKSQLIADIKNGIFNGEAVHMRGSTDLNVKNVYCSIDLKLYNEGRVEEAVKPRPAAHKMLHIMEEFNRTPPVVANQWLAVGDGVLDIDGRQIALGKGHGCLFGRGGEQIPVGRSYRVAIGAANIGNGEFVGTFQTDNALKERLVLALDFDGIHRPGELDYWNIFENSCDPRVLESQKVDNRSLMEKLRDDIQTLAKDIDCFVRLIQVYLARGLDEVKIGGNQHSKEEFPQLHSVVENDADARGDILNYVATPSVRAVKVFGALVPSLAAVAVSKGATAADNVTYDSCLGALELILPFSDSLPKKLLDNSKGSRRLAAKELVRLIVHEMPSSELLAEGLRKAYAGALQDKDTTVFEKPRVRCFSRFLKQLNEVAVRNGANGTGRAQRAAVT